MKASSARSLFKPAPVAIMSAALVTVAPLLVGTGIATAQSLPIYPGPTYDQSTGNGYQNATFSGAIGNPLSPTGLAVGYANLYAAGVNKLARGVLLNAGGSAIQLTGLTADLSLAAASEAYTINAAGQSVGYANKQVGGSNLGDRAVRWSAAGSVVELGTLGLDGAGVTNSYAYGINAAGQSVGMAAKYVGGINLGDYAVRWDAATGVATELGTIVSSKVYGVAYTINSSSQAAGQMSKYDGNQYKGERAVRWNAAGTALELANLGLSNQSVTNSFAYAINSSGLIAGYSAKYSSGLKGDRAVRWDSATGAITELGNLGLDGTSTTYSYAFAINDAGQVTGRAFKYVSGVSKGERAVRWDAAGAALELGDLGLSATGTTSASAYSINSLGQTAGRSKLYVSGVDQGDRAVYWTAAGAAVDLNTLISPTSNWTLTRARAISDNGWIAGYGMFDPDGVGALAAYQRHFLLNIATESSWLNAAGGSWGTGTNWFTNFAPSSAVDALFNLNSVSGYTVNVSSAPSQAKNLIVKTDKVTLNITGGNTLALNSITVGRDSGDVANLTSSAGIVTLTGPLTIANATGTTGTFTLTGGTFTAPSIISKGNFNYNGGTLNATTVQLAGSGLMKLSTGGNKTLKVTTLSITNTSKLDLTDNKLITNDAAGTESGGVYGDVQGLVQLAHNGGAWNGATGITTSLPDAATGLTTIGVSTGALARSLGPTDTAVWAAQTINGNSTMVMYTYAGDANLDGFIDGTDYFYIDSNVGTSADGYGYGDFNYDGSIDGTDYFFIDNNITVQGAPFFASGEIGGGVGGGGGEFLTGVAAVPEPALGAVLAGFLFGSMNLRCRRRNTRYSY